MASHMTPLFFRLPVPRIYIIYVLIGDVILYSLVALSLVVAVAILYG